MTPPQIDTSTPKPMKGDTVSNRTARRWLVTFRFDENDPGDIPFHEYDDKSVADAVAISLMDVPTVFRVKVHEVDYTVEYTNRKIGSFAYAYRIKECAPGPHADRDRRDGEG